MFNYQKTAPGQDRTGEFLNYTNIFGNRILYGGDKRVRTDDPLLAKQVLYQLSYVPTCGLYLLIYTQSFISKQVLKWSGRRDSNPRPQPWQGCALPLSYSRIFKANANIMINSIIAITFLQFFLFEIYLRLVKNFGFLKINSDLSRLILTLTLLNKISTS